MGWPKLFIIIKETFTDPQLVRKHGEDFSLGKHFSKITNIVNFVDNHAFGS